jgi:hypothetical protein
MRRKAFLVFCLLVFVSASAGFSQEVPNIQWQALYETRQWFALRVAMTQVRVPVFYRGATEAAFNQIDPAQKHLQAVIRAAPNSRDA